MKKFNLDLISYNRNTIYGLSILWIMFFHSSLTFQREWINNIKKLGECGVDVFLFVSGISLYFSYTKNQNIKDFYRKRIQRIFLPTLFTAIPSVIAPSESLLSHTLDTFESYLTLDSNVPFIDVPILYPSFATRDTSDL